MLLQYTQQREQKQALSTSQCRRNLTQAGGKLH